MAAISCTRSWMALATPSEATAFALDATTEARSKRLSSSFVPRDQPWYRKPLRPSSPTAQQGSRQYDHDQASAPDHEQIHAAFDRNGRLAATSGGANAGHLVAGCMIRHCRPGVRTLGDLGGATPARSGSRLGVDRRRLRRSEFPMLVLLVRVRRE